MAMFISPDRRRLRLLIKPGVLIIKVQKSQPNQMVDIGTVAFSPESLWSQAMVMRFQP